MKKIILLTIVSFLGLTLAFAQHGKKGKNKNLTPEQRVERNIKRLTKHLALTTDQQSQIRGAVTTKVNGMETLRNNGKDKKANRTERKNIKQTFDRELTAVLTAEQKQKYDAWKAERKAKRQSKKGKKGSIDDEEF